MLTDDELAQLLDLLAKHQSAALELSHAHLAGQIVALQTALHETVRFIDRFPGPLGPLRPQLAALLMNEAGQWPEEPEVATALRQLAELLQIPRRPTPGDGA